MSFYATIVLVATALTAMSCNSGSFKDLYDQKPSDRDSKSTADNSTKKETKEETSTSAERSESSSDSESPSDKPVMITGSWLTCSFLDENQPLKWGCNIYTAPDQKYLGTIEKWDIYVKTKDETVIKVENFSEDPVGVWQITFDIPSALASEPFSLDAAATSDGISITETSEYSKATQHFEDISGLVTGVGGRMKLENSTNLDGVEYKSVGTESNWNFSGDYHENTPFYSDWLAIWTYGEGATMTFPAEVSSITFDAGDTGYNETGGTFQVLANGQIVRSFTLTNASLLNVTASWLTPTKSVIIKFVSGTSSLLGIDNLSN